MNFVVPGGLTSVIVAHAGWRGGAAATSDLMPPVIGLSPHPRGQRLWWLVKCPPRNHAGGE
jgi:hypothetical protein